MNNLVSVICMCAGVIAELISRSGIGTLKRTCVYTSAGFASCPFRAVPLHLPLSQQCLTAPLSPG